MDDSDSRVRFYACESLYNVTKVVRDAILPLFNECFIAMAKVVTDLDQSVRTAAELLDRLLKDIITENLTFSTENFIPILKQCMYTQHPFGRSFCIGWVHTMHKVPNPIILKYIPDLLDPMFLFLTDDKHEIYVRCQRELLVIFLKFTTHFRLGSTSGWGPLPVRVHFRLGVNSPKMQQNILLHSSLIMPDIGLNSIFCCLKMKSVSSILGYFLEQF